MSSTYSANEAISSSMRQSAPARPANIVSQQHVNSRSAIFHENSDAIGVAVPLSYGDDKDAVIQKLEKEILASKCHLDTTTFTLARRLFEVC